MLVKVPVPHTRVKDTDCDAINNKLSQERVDAIKNYLIDKGINPNRIVIR